MVSPQSQRATLRQFHCLHHPRPVQTPVYRYIITITNVRQFCSSPSTPSSNTCIQVHNYSHTSPSLSPSSPSTPSSNTWCRYTTTLSITVTHGSECIKGRKHCTTAGIQLPWLNLMVITGWILLSVLSVFCFMSVHTKVILGDPFEYLHWNQPSNSSAVCSLMTSLAFLQTPSTIIQFLSLRT